jgi:hypothetical protein
MDNKQIFIDNVALQLARTIALAKNQTRKSFAYCHLNAPMI